MNYIVEFSKDRHEHELVNSCALYIWQEVFNHDTKFFGSQAHKEALEQFLPDLKVDQFQHIDILPRKRGNKMQWLKIYKHEFALVIEILKQAKEKHVDFIVFLSISPITLFFVRLYLKIFKIKSKLIFTFHGELQYLVQKDLRPAERFMRSLIKFNLASVDQNIYYSVYGQTIKRKLIALHPHLCRQFLNIEHPFVSKGSLIAHKLDIMQIGAFGAISQHKNSHKIVELAEMMHLINPQLHFKLVGKFIDRPVYNEDILTIVGGEEFLSRKDYEKQILNTAWLIYLYEDRNYELIASGAFLDAVIYNKPIICLRNKFFEHVFDRYEIGIMVDSIDKLPTALVDLYARKDLYNFYALCQANIKRYANDHVLSTHANILRKQIIQINDA